MFKWTIKLNKDFHVETKEKKNAEKSEWAINFEIKLGRWAQSEGRFELWIDVRGMASKNSSVLTDQKVFNPSTLTEN